jgi:hypothetical protein
MSDKSALLVYFVAAAILVAGLIALAKPILRRFPHLTRPFELQSWRRWWVSGFDRVRRIALVWTILALGVGLGTVVSIANVYRSTQVPPNDPRRMDFYPPPALGSWWNETRWLGQSALSGGGELLPFPQVAAITVLPLLWLARPRGVFPFSRGSRAAAFWKVVGTFFWLLLLFQLLTSLWPSAVGLIGETLARHTELFFLFLVLFVALFGFGLVLPPLFASLDERINARLSSRDCSIVKVFLRLVALQLLLWVASAPASLVSYLRPVTGFDFPWRLENALRSVQQLSGATIVPVLMTATLTTCMAGSLREVVRKTIRWWRRDFLFLLPLVLLTGLFEGVGSLLLRGLFGALPENRFSTTVYYALHSEVSLVISLSAFCLLLGNWLDQKEPVQPSLPPETFPEPAG